MSKSLIFDESSWSYIEKLLPNDEMVREVVLNDFIWFVQRPANYKSNQHMIDAYAHHLELKKNPIIKNSSSNIQCFRSLDVDMIKMILIGKYVK